MIRICAVIVLLSAVLSAGGVFAQQSSVKPAPAAQAKVKAVPAKAIQAPQAVTGGETKKTVVDEKTLLEIKRQVRLMRQEMADLEERLDRMTTVRENDKGKYRE